jgi:hypothetical protein
MTRWTLYWDEPEIYFPFSIFHLSSQTVPADVVFNQTTNGK